jgi:hypothetical protein
VFLAGHTLEPLERVAADIAAPKGMVGALPPRADSVASWVGLIFVPSGVLRPCAL